VGGREGSFGLVLFFVCLVSRSHSHSHSPWRNGSTSSRCTSGYNIPLSSIFESNHQVVRGFGFGFGFCFGLGLEFASAFGLGLGPGVGVHVAALAQHTQGGLINYLGHRATAHDRIDVCLGRVGIVHGLNFDRNVKVERIFDRVCCGYIVDAETVGNRGDINIGNLEQARVVQALLLDHGLDFVLNQLFEQSLVITVQPGAIDVPVSWRRSGVLRGAGEEGGGGRGRGGGG